MINRQPVRNCGSWDVFLVAVLTLLFGGICRGEVASVQSPDGRIQLGVELVDQQVSYQVRFRDELLIAPSTITFVLEDGRTIGNQLKFVTSEQSSHRSTWKPVYGERSVVEDNYNEILLDFHDAAVDYEFRLVFRCYDAGIAFQSILGRLDASEVIQINEERSEFRFYGDHLTWCTTTAQGKYEQRPISLMGTDVERPLVTRVDEDTYAAIAEAKLVEYARMKLMNTDDLGYGVVSQLSGPVQSSLPVATPWRVIMIGKSPGELLENNDIILNLNDPCAIADTSWIKPGKVIRDITLSTEGGKACIEFASRHNLQYVEFDAGWYGPEFENDSDATTISVDPSRSPGPLDLHYLIDYAEQHGIGVILYVNRRALERQLDEILPLYKSWGVAGIKFGFVHVGSQGATTWLHEAIRKAAEHELMVDVHDEYRPTGYSRTYPNLVTQEGVRGDEAIPPTEQTLTSLFTRTLAGASDFKICYFASRVDDHWSHAHQLAKAVCFYDPWQFLFWYDSPLVRKEDGQEAQDNVIRENPELEFFAAMPTTWDDTKVLFGEISQYAVIARRKGGNWFIAALNNNKPRTLEVPLSFLDENIDYTAHIYSDDPEVKTASQVRIDRRAVDANATLKVSMRSNGGQAVRLVPTKGNR